jgi:hypothetical protein
VKPVKHRNKPGRNRIQPTATQIRQNVIVVPRYYINENRNILRWFHTFDVSVNGVVRTGRHLDMENRIGGIALNGFVNEGDILKLTIRDGCLILTTDSATPKPAE